MWKDITASWPILLGIGFMMLANGLQGTLLGVRATIEGFSPFTTGIIMTGYFIGIFAGSFIAPFLVKRVGHIRVFSALASLASISILFHGVYLNVFIWFAMRIITGICFAGFYVVTESWLNQRASNQSRGKLLSIYMLIVTISMGSGQLLLTLAEPTTLDLFVLISVIISAGLIPMLLTAKPAPLFESSEKMSVFALYRASPLAFIGNYLTGMSHGTIFGLGAVYASTVLPDIQSISWFMTSLLVGGAICQWPIGYISDYLPRRLMMTILSLVVIPTSLTAAVVAKDSYLFYCITMLLGGASMPMYSICIAYANDRLEPHQIVAASGSLVMIAGMGLCTGPVIISYLMDLYSINFFFWGISAISAIMLGFTLVRINSRPGILTEDQGHIIASGPIGTPIAEYNAPNALDYAEAIANEEIDLPKKEKVQDDWVL